MKSTKRSLFTSALALFLCFSMLLGTTFAWFTDTVTSGNNKIVSGSLKVDLELFDKETGTWESIKNSQKAIFDHKNWEPGYTDVKVLRITNKGSLALKWDATIIPLDELTALADVIDVYVYSGKTAPNARPGRNDLESEGYHKVGTLREFAEGLDTESASALLAGESDYLGIALKMRESAGNEYKNTSCGEFDIRIVATQYSAENEKDSFDENYDNEAQFPVFKPADVNLSVQTANGFVTADAYKKTGSASMKALAGTKVTDDRLSLNVSEMAASGSNVKLEENEAILPLDVHVDGVAADNTKPIIITLDEAMMTGLNIGNYKLYHVEDGVANLMTAVSSLDELDAHNEFYYDPATGNVSLAMATFSEVAMVADTENAWEGNFDYSWYDASKTELAIANADQLAAFGAIVGGMDGQTQNSFAGKTVKLTSDINLGDKESENDPDIIFYPIGYYNSEGTYERTNTAITSGLRNFEGTFDGNGHTVSNFYHNTWEMKGDHDWYSPEEQYYRDGMGLFGRVYKGTVKNLTVKNFSSDGEIATTGVIAAYADGATFENIAIFDCNPRVYNIGNGGIVGCVGWYAKEEGLKTTFTNITVDNSNKISALWGSYDVACGGIVGQYYPTSGQSFYEYPENAGIHFENCHISAQMDVYNDVCANYQYYAYRYTGMLIGSVRENETIDGHVYPKMDGITASDCTVHFGTWNDYYYCEFEKNGHPSYSGPDDYKFSRIPHSEINFTDSNGNGIIDTEDERASVTGCKHEHTAAENNQAVYLQFNNLVTGYGWGVTTKVVGELDGVTILDRDVADSVKKFETKFTGDFLYRVGNKNTVSIGNLFKVAEDIPNALKNISSSAVWVTIEAVDENMTVGGTYTKPTTGNWEDGKIQFNGTGVVKVTIQDYIFCTPTVLYLEVVDAVNATTATSATSNNVVLLKDCGFSSLEVSGGYALYGNGFTMTCGSDSAALDMGYAFVTLNNGTLDNVQIVCPNFDYAVLYKSNMTESGNRSETTDKTRYFNVKSGVMVSGNSQILNSRISGARAAVNVTGGNCVIDNSRLELGAVASLLVGSANSVTLRDATLVQKPTASTYDPSKTLMGFSVLMICDANGDAAPLTLEGTLVQNAWVDENDKQYVPSAGQSIISTVLAKTEYLHDLDGDGTEESLNLGFAYMPESLTSKVNTTTITDNRTNKDAIPYDYAEVSILNGSTYVYSYKNSNGTADSFKTEAEYVPNKYGDIITVNYDDVNENRVLSKVYGDEGWIYQLAVDLDQGAYTFDFSKLTVQKNGEELGISRSDKVNVEEGTTEYSLTLADGSTITFKLIGTATTKDAPQWSNDVNGSILSSSMNASWEAGLCVASSKGGTWSGAAPALQNVYVRYYSTEAKAYKIIHLADYTPSVTGKVNGSNTTCTISGPDFTLTLTGGQVHSSNKVNAIPVVCDGKLYFVAATSNGLVNSGNSARNVPVTYSFTDGFGNTITGSHTWSVAEDQDNEYSYSDFCNGTLNKLESSSGGNTACLAAGTMITLADGTKRAVEDLRKGDMVMSFDHVTGKLTAESVIIVVKTAQDNYHKNTFIFDDGTELVTINEHGIFDLDLNMYVNIDHANYEQFIGHRFVSVDTNGNIGTKTLVDVITVLESGYKYDIVTNGTLNYVAEDTLSVTHVLVDVINTFDFGADLKYDAEKMQSDIETYGLYTYDEWDEYCDISVFEEYNIPVMKVGITKGLYTKEYIIHLINTYVLDDSVQIID